MKKIFLLIFTFIFFQNTVFADIEESAPEQDKYTVIKTNNNYSPIRDAASVNARRFSHLKKGAKIFAEDFNEEFFKIDLGLGKYYWIEKRYVDVEKKTDKKEFSKIKSIQFDETEDFYTVKIKTPVLTAYNEIETTDKTLDFILYDVILDEENLNIKGENDKFKISKDEFDNLKISYSNNKLLTGHDVQVFDDGLVLKVKKPFKTRHIKPLHNIKVVIDPGHGGADSGACANGLKEKDINFQISKILVEKLEKQGAKAYLTREEDVDADLYERIDFAKEKNADFLISIHQNSLPNRKKYLEKHGVGVYYYNKEAYKLAKEIQNSLIEGTNFRDDGVNFASFALTRSPLPICILVECGYIIHPEEAKKLSDSEFQKLLCDYLIKGLKNYLKENF